MALVFFLFFPGIVDKGQVASSVSSFMNFISFLDKTTYLIMDIEIIDTGSELFSK